MTVRELIQKLLPYEAERIVVINSTDEPEQDRIATDITVYQNDVIIEGIKITGTD